MRKEYKWEWAGTETEEFTTSQRRHWGTRKWLAWQWRDWWNKPAQWNTRGTEIEGCRWEADCSDIECDGDIYAIWTGLFSIVGFMGSTIAVCSTCMIVFLLLLSSDRLVQIWLTPSRWCLHKTAAFYTEQCMTPLLFDNFEVSQGACNRPINNYGFMCDAIYFICAHA